MDAKIVMQSNDRRVSWVKSLSPYGYQLALVVSAMGKEIRRGNEEMASFWAYQMMISGAEAEEFCWERLEIISLEDVGLAVPEALGIVQSTQKLYYRLPSRNPDRYAAGIFAVCYLSRCKKTRYSHELCGDLVNRLNSGYKPELPDYALDVHTQEGRAAGRNLLHYLTEASALHNADERFPTTYHERLVEWARHATT